MSLKSFCEALRISWSGQYRKERSEPRSGYWIKEDYNRLYVHSTLGYLSPEEFAQGWAQPQEATSAGVQI